MKQPSRAVLSVIAALLLIAIALLSWRSFAQAAPEQPGTPSTALVSGVLVPEATPGPVPGGPGFYAQSGAAFVPSKSTHQFVNDGRSLWNTGAVDEVFVAPVSLPNGAIVTKFVVYYYDIDPTHSMWASLGSYYDLTNAGTLMAYLPSTTLPDNPAFTYAATTSITGPVIDNQSRLYVVTIDLGPGGQDLRMLGFRIDYNYASTLPLVSK